MEFLNLALTFPTIIFTALLLVVVLFWAITLLGFADIDMFESDLDIEANSSNTNSTGLFSSFGFGSIPITVSISLVVMLSWLVNIYAHKLFAYLLGDGILFYVFGLVMLVVSAIIALPIAIIISKPLQGFFSSVETSRSSDLLGLECTVVTGKVTSTFGQGRINFQGTEQLIQIRSHDEHPYSTGDTVVLLEHIKEQHCYIVTAKPW